MATWQYILLAIAGVASVGGASFPDFFVNLWKGRKSKRTAKVNATPAAGKADASDELVEGALAAGTLLTLYANKCPEAQKKLQDALACMYEPPVKTAAVQMPAPEDTAAALQVLAAAVATQQA